MLLFGAPSWYSFHARFDFIPRLKKMHAVKAEIVEVK